MTATKGLNRFSSRITQPKSQGASQAMLFGTGLTSEDMDKPQVGISSVWYEGNTCNMHLDQLAAEVKQGVEASGMVGMRFNTIGVSDGISMGTEGMSYSLQSRDLIADSIETVMGAQWYDANVSLPGCDKNMPCCGRHLIFSLYIRRVIQCGPLKCNQIFSRRRLICMGILRDSYPLTNSLFIGDTTLRSRPHQPNIFVECSPRGLEWRRTPASFSLCKNRITQVDCYCIAICVDCNRIALLK